MNVSDFKFVAQLIQERSGLMLRADKAYLMESRLNPVMRRHGFKGFDELVAALRDVQEGDLVKDVVEAMATNETSFFRDRQPFDQFRLVVLPHLLAHREASKTIRIWCAGCSAGQEPYSLAIILKENQARLEAWNIEILATDLSEPILEKARQGLYSHFEIQRGLPISLLIKYFQKEEDRWRIDKAIRDMVRFERFNLLDAPTELGAFDVVLCRNVLIYFDQETKSAVLERIAGVTVDDGFLYLGSVETILNLTEHFDLIPGHRGIYSPSNPADMLAVKTVG